MTTHRHHVGVKRTHCKHCGARLRRDPKADIGSSAVVRRPAGYRLAEILVRHGIIDPGSVEDPEGYDGGATMARVAGTAQEICEMMAYNAKIADTGPVTPDVA